MNGMVASTKERYKHWTSISLRYADVDSLGHVNNVVFCALLESGRVELFFDGISPQGGKGKTFVIANLNINFLAEMHYPGTAEVGTALVSFGRSSCKLVQAIFCGGKCCATAESTIVLIDERTRKSEAIPPAVQEAIAKIAG